RRVQRLQLGHDPQPEQLRGRLALQPDRHHLEPTHDPLRPAARFLEGPFVGPGRSLSRGLSDSMRTRWPCLMLALAALAACTKAHRPEPLRNVLLITIDTLRAARLGAYGDFRARTPVIDRLARGGARFERAHAHNVVTLPSHANILSGVYPTVHGVHDNDG